MRNRSSSVRQHEPDWSDPTFEFVYLLQHKTGPPTARLSTHIPAYNDLRADSAGETNTLMFPA